MISSSFWVAACLSAPGCHWSGLDMIGLWQMVFSLWLDIICHRLIAFPSNQGNFFRTQWLYHVAHSFDGCSNIDPDWYISKECTQHHFDCLLWAIWFHTALSGLIAQTSISCSMSKEDSSVSLICKLCNVCWPALLWISRRQEAVSMYLNLSCSITSLW